MEAAIDEWDKEAEKEVEEEEKEEGLQRKRLLQHTSTSSSSDKDIQGGSLDFNKSEKKEEFEVITTQINKERILIQQVEIDKSTILPVSSFPPQIIQEGSSILTNETSEIRTISIVKEHEDGRQELYLERVYEKPPNSGFYCPNCKACIQTVYILKGEWEEQQPSAPAKPVQPKPVEPIRCTSCFSFLIPIGNWLFPSLKSGEDEAINEQDDKRIHEHSQATQETIQDKAPKQDQSKEESQPGSKETSKPDNNIANDSEKDKNIIKNEVPLVSEPKVEDETKEPEPESIPAYKRKEEKDEAIPKKKKKPFWINWLVIGGVSDEASKTPKDDDSAKSRDWKFIPEDLPHTKPPKKIEFPSVEEKPDHVEVTVVDEESTGQSEEEAVTDESTPLLPSRELTVVTRRSNKRLEILKSIVYGGLIESLASLSVVTSAASVDATTLNIVALSIANLIGGLFVLGHNLRELKAEEPEQSENQTNARVDRYNELLGQRENFILHVFISVLSFIIFGLIPPIVYGFSFQESDDKYYKLAAVAVSSLICVILLSFAKAHIQRPRSYVTYFQTVAYYVTTGAVASVISYLAGQLVDKILEKLGLFESKSSDFGLKVDRHGIMRGKKTAWSSY